MSRCRSRTIRRAALNEVLCVFGIFSEIRVSNSRQDSGGDTDVCTHNGGICPGRSAVFAVERYVVIYRDQGLEGLRIFQWANPPSALVEHRESLENSFRGGVARPG